MLAHSDVIAGRPREAQPEELCSIMAHYREEKERSSVCERESERKEERAT